MEHLELGDESVKVSNIIHIIYFYKVFKSELQI